MNNKLFDKVLREEIITRGVSNKPRGKVSVEELSDAVSDCFPLLNTIRSGLYDYAWDVKGFKKDSEASHKYVQKYADAIFKALHGILDEIEYYESNDGIVNVSKRFRK